MMRGGRVVKEDKQLAARQPSADDGLARNVDPVYLKDCLGKIKTNAGGIHEDLLARWMTHLLSPPLCGGGPCHQVAAPASLHADRGNGRYYTAADRRRSGQTSTHGGLTDGHLFTNPFFHHLDGCDPPHLTCGFPQTPRTHSFDS